MTPQIIFNLYPFQEGLYLPTANLVRPDADGLPAHILQKATLATIQPYGIPLTPELQRLFEWIDVLAPKNIELKFKAPKAKNTTPLAQLLSDKTTKPVVESYIFRQLDLFLNELARRRLALTLDAEKKTLAKDVLVQIAPAGLIPYLSFHKKTDGIEYRLQLGTDTERWSIHEKEVMPLTNTDPAWILIGYDLYKVAGINGNMVKPFRQKEVLQIPADKEKMYFRQFIAKSISRSRVEAEGFRVQEAKTLRQTRLEPVENVLEQCWMLKPLFEYDGAVFQAGEKRDRVTSLDIPKDDNGDITVHLICRDQAAEQLQTALLATLGLRAHGSVYHLPETSGTTARLDSLAACIDFLARHRQALEAAGFYLVQPEVDGRTLQLSGGDIRVASQAAGDWFDVHGIVTIGPFSFPFRALLPNLRRRDPFFKLPDDSWFLIPEAWFTRYADLAQSVQEGAGDILRLPKALYTVLQETEMDSAPADFPLIDPDTIEFSPPAELKADLRPYQLRGVKWLVGHYREGFGACLADDMGLGKTLQTITLLLHAKTANTSAAAGAGGLQLDLFNAYQESLRPLNALIILPASLVFNWQRELQKFAPTLFVYVHTGPKRLKDVRAMAGHDVILTTYHTARQDLALLSKQEWHFIILDESQQIKNRDSEVSKVVRELKGRQKLSLSGTPIENSLADLWTQMEFINPDTLGSFASFKSQFLDPIQKQNDEKAKTRLFSRVKPFFMRRTKEEVAPDLPALSEQLFFTEMPADQRKRYEQIKSAMRNEILSLFDDPKTRLQALQALTRLRQLANHPLLTDPDYTGDSGKFSDVLAQWDTIRRAGHKVLFFSSFEKHLQLFRRFFEQEKIPFAWLTGDTPQAERAREVTRFQEDPEVQAFMMTIKAGGVGLNLTAADYVFLLDPWWNPAVEAQAIARAHRIGQQRPVTALRFISRDSIEEKIVELQERKRALGQALFENNAENPELSREELALLIS